MSNESGTRHGGIFTGGGSITAQYVAGGDQHITQGSHSDQLDSAFKPLWDHVRSSPPDVQAPAVDKIQQLKTELSKGKDAKDGTTAKLIDALVGLVPSAVSAIGSTFASPVLSGLTGPATKYVLEKIQGG